MDNPNIQSYMAQLTEREKLALEVAKRCLETSFDMEKTIGYQTWLKLQSVSTNENEKIKGT